MRHGDYRTADYHRVKTQQDALFYSASIPYLYWKKEDITPMFLPIANCGAYDQETKFKTLISKDTIFKKPYLIFIGSSDEYSSLLISYDLMKKALLLDNKVQITDSSLVQEEIVIDETVFMLTNIFDRGTNERVMKARDWIYRHKEYFRIVTMACDPYEFSLQIRVTPNAMFNVNVTKSNIKEFV